MDRVLALSESVVAAAWIFIAACVLVAVLSGLEWLVSRLIVRFRRRSGAKVLPMRRPKDRTYTRPNGAA